jgi:hypothetical protein
MRSLIAVLLIVHGLIVAAQSTGSFAPGSHVANPAWLRWWPTALGQSWLLAALRAEGGAPAALAGIIWLAGGLALAAAGLGLLGVLVPPTWWATLALAGGFASLFMLLIYFHPFLGVGIAASAVLLVGLLWAQEPWLTVVGT